jgi:membrane protein implicated in regulation of membrane protease activity
MLWLIFGAILCSLELILPTAYVAFMMGVSALIVALISFVVPSVPLQMALWVVCSGLLIFQVPRFLPQIRSEKIRDTVEAETLTEIPPGKCGRVIYEGNSWQARCEDSTMLIESNQKVYVLRREGTTLIVLPENLLHS